MVEENRRLIGFAADRTLVIVDMLFTMMSQTALLIQRITTVDSSKNVD